jgi:predicted secreted protein
MPALSAHGSTVSFDSELIGGLTTIGLPDEEKEEIEITSHDSQGVREFVAGLRDSGTATLGMRLIPGNAGQDALRTNYNATGNPTVEVVITLPAQAGIGQLMLTFNAYCSSLGGGLPYDDAAERSAGLRISGAVTETLLSV